MSHGWQFFQPKRFLVTCDPHSQPIELHPHQKFHIKATLERDRSFVTLSEISGTANRRKEALLARSACQDIGLMPAASTHAAEEVIRSRSFAAARHINTESQKEKNLCNCVFFSIPIVGSSSLVQLAACQDGKRQNKAP